MNVSGASAAMSPSRAASRPVGTGGSTAAEEAGGSAPATVASDFLKYAKMSPMERMRANLLKGMNLTEEQLGALPQDEQRKIEERIKDGIKKMVSETGRTGQLVDLSA